MALHINEISYCLSANNEISNPFAHKIFYCMGAVGYVKDT